MMLAVDIGGSKYRTAGLTATGELQQVTTHIFDGRRGFDEFYRQLVPALRQLMAEFGPNEVQGIGLALPGLTDVDRGLLIFAPYSGWRHIPFRDLLTKEFQLPVYVENDVKACAIAEKQFGNCQVRRNFIWVTLSNGIGAALFIEGRLYRGAQGFAGEVGHIVVAPRGPRCGCGQRGCLEAVASAAAIARQVRRRMPSEPNFARLFAASDNREIVSRVFTYARAGEVECVAILKRAAAYIGIALASAVNLFNPEAIIFGGGMALSFDWLKPHIFHALRTRTLPDLTAPLELEVTDLGEHAALIGAGARGFVATDF